MKSISSIPRIVFGLAVVAFAFFTYHRIIPRVEAGEAVQLFGHPVNATPSQFTTAFTAIGVMGVMGAVVIVLGAVAMRKKQ
jgi:ABC-type Na+ efflux pump permease subunit